MTLDALTTAGTLAIVIAATFLVAARIWQALAGFAAGGPVFPDSTMREAAQRFRDEADKLRGNYASYLAALLVFGLIFGAAIGLGIRGFYDGYPTWQLNIVIVVLSSAATFVFYKILSTLKRLSATRFRRDANIAVGHQLLRLAASQGSVFHDIEVAGGVVDHVLLGHNGAYAVHVIARRRRGDGQARLKGETLELGDVGRGLEQFTNQVHKLGAAFSNEVGHKIKVRSVIAVPGWDVEEQSSESHLLVNERTLPILTGWKSKADYLMNEDVAAIQDFLMDRGRR